MTPSNNIIELQNSIQPLVGVIDTGFNINMPGINYSQIQLGQDLIDSDSNPLLTEVVGHEHGSYTLQTIASSNNNAPLWIGRAVGSGRWAESLVEFVDVAKESTQPNAIVNLGFDLTQVNPDGIVTTRYELTEPERAAIEYARQNGILIVVAAGNENGAMSALGQASQEFDNIITVGSTENLKRADYSSYGSGLILLADGDMGNMAGTSFATSKVTGAISQVWAANPQLNYHQVFDILKTTATDLDVSGWDSETGYGLLNLTDAINLATMTTSIPYQTPPVETVSQILDFLHK